MLQEVALGPGRGWIEMRIEGGWLPWCGYHETGDGHRNDRGLERLRGDVVEDQELGHAAFTALGEGGSAVLGAVGSRVGGGHRLGMVTTHVDIKRTYRHVGRGGVGPQNKEQAGACATQQGTDSHHHNTGKCSGMMAMTV